MSQDRLNSLAMLNIVRQQQEKLDFKDINKWLSHKVWTQSHINKGTHKASYLLGGSCREGFDEKAHSYQRGLTAEGQRALNDSLIVFGQTLSEV